MAVVVGPFLHFIIHNTCRTIADMTPGMVLTSYR